MSEIKRALLEKKQKLINSLKYIEGRIKETQRKPQKVYESESSDSDFDFTKAIDLGPSISTLEQKKKDLKICQQATVELTSVQVLQSEMTLQVEEVTIDGEPVEEPGDWYEVVAECRLDLVPFLITFLVHKSSRKFGPVHYRKLCVTPLKKAHESELNPGLVDLKRPADAVEIIRQYSEKHRSRRTILAKLADAFAGALSMAPVPDGGYILKCLDMLEITWLIKYSKSKFRFNHAMKFDIDHMDENYIMVIKNAYQQLNHTTTTEKRFLLLEEIIRTCIEASGRTDFGETTTDQSDHEVIDKLLQKPLQNNANKLVNDGEIMAPPKSLPKEIKSKGEKNKDRSSTTKKNNDEIVEVPAKKSKKESTTGTDFKSQDVIKGKDVSKKSSNEKQKISPTNKKNVNTVDLNSKTGDRNTKTIHQNKHTDNQSRKTDDKNKKAENVNKKSLNENKRVVDQSKKSDQSKKPDQRKEPLIPDNVKEKKNVPEKNKKNMSPNNGKSQNGANKNIKNNKENIINDKINKVKETRAEIISAKKNAKNVARTVSKIPKLKPSHSTTSSGTSTARMPPRGQRSNK